MAINLVSLVLDALTPDIIAKIALALGLDRGAAQKAISAAAPALLAALSGVAAKPGGARALQDAVSGQDPGVLASVAKMLDGSGSKALAEQGSGLLASLLGGSTQSQIANVVGKFSGLGEGTSSSLLGILAPFVLGTLRKQTASSPDASGLANLLSSQKDNILAAMPPGFARLLEGTNVLDSLGGRAAAAAQTTATMVQRAPEKSSSSWLTWAIPVLALAGLAWYFLAPRAQHTTEPTATTTTQPPATTTNEPMATTTTKPPAATTTEPMATTTTKPPAATTTEPMATTTTKPPATTTTEPMATTTTTPPATTTTEPMATTTQPMAGASAGLMVDGVDLGASVTSTIDGLKASLQGITDAATAKTELPKLQEAAIALEKVKGMTGKLQAGQKSALAALITAALPVINPLIDKITAIPGVSDIVKPAIDSLRAQLDALAKA